MLSLYLPPSPSFIALPAFPSSFTRSSLSPCAPPNCPLLHFSPPYRPLTIPPSLPPSLLALPLSASPPSFISLSAHLHSLHHSMLSPYLLPLPALPSSFTPCSPLPASPPSFLHFPAFPSSIPHSFTSCSRAPTCLPPYFLFIPPCPAVIFLPLSHPPTRVTSNTPSLTPCSPPLHTLLLSASLPFPPSCWPPSLPPLCGLHQGSVNTGPTYLSNLLL